MWKCCSRRMSIMRVLHFIQSFLRNAFFVHLYFQITYPNLEIIINIDRSNTGTSRGTQTQRTEKCNYGRSHQHLSESVYILSFLVVRQIGKESLN